MSMDQSGQTPSQANKIWAPERVMTISPSLRLEWFANDQIIAYVLSDMDRDVLQNWSEVALDTINKWPFPKPYLALHDLSRHGLIITYSLLTDTRILNIGAQPSANRTVVELSKQKPDFRARVAVNLSLSFSGDVGRLLADIGTLDQSGSKIQYQVFTDRRKALNWLSS